MKRLLGLLLRTALAVLFGVIVTFMSLMVARFGLIGPANDYQQRITFRGMRTNDQAILAYARRNHVLPRNLYQLGSNAIIRDGWGSPFIYNVQGTHYTVISYGSDGKPGGDGWAIDMTSDKTYDQFALPTLSQILHASAMRDMVTAAVSSGVLAAVVCFITIWPGDPTRGKAGIVQQFLWTLAAAAFIGSMITVMQVPSGH